MILTIKSFFLILFLEISLEEFSRRPHRPDSAGERIRRRMCVRTELKNKLTREYFADNRRFAEVCCHGLFDGKLRLDPETLHPADTTELVFQGFWPEEAKALWKDRDIIKECRDGAKFILIGIENQTEVHFCMPLRCLVYDTLRYEEQRLEIAREHQRKKDLTGPEFLSGFSRNDRLTPVFTLVLYFGEEEWDAAVSLKELLDIPDYMKEFENKFLDYRINLLDVMRITNLDQYSDELKALFGFIKYQKDKTALRNFVKQNESIFCRMDPESARAIAVLGNAGKLEQIMKKNKKDGEETVDVCQALLEMMDEARLEGRDEGMQKGLEQGREEGREEGLEAGRRKEMERGIRIFIEDNLEEGVPSERICEKLKRRYALSDEDADRYFLTI